MEKQKENKQIALFQGKKIRKIIYRKEWWFSVVDVCGILTESPTPRQYWEKVKTREFPDFQSSPNWGQLKLEPVDGKKYATDCANTEGALRIIQSINNILDFLSNLQNKLEYQLKKKKLSSGLTP